METIYDIAIIGGGPAGLSAAVTAGVRGKKTILLERREFSARLRKAHEVSNYLGLEHITGTELMDKFLQHAQSFSPEILMEKVVFGSRDEAGFTLGTSVGFYRAKTVILAIGSSTAGILPGEKELLGRGVSYCATCDGNFFRGKRVAVIITSPGDWPEVEFLAEICAEVLVFPMFKTERAADAKIKVFTEKPQGIMGAAKVEALRTAQAEHVVDGVFIMRESDPAEALFPEVVLKGKYIGVDENMATNLPGVFAAGDCTGQPWQISRATGQGLVAALSAVNYLSAHNKIK